MNPRAHLAIIGSGASSIYLLKHLLAQAPQLSPHIQQITIFEKSHITGMGMPYSPQTTDRYNMSNISSEELPELPQTFGDWLRAQDAEVLRSLDLEGVEISDSEVYSRLALGQYLHAQYQTIIAQLTATGLQIHEHPGCKIVDIHEHPSRDNVILTTGSRESLEFDRVVIATGHYWSEEDRPQDGFYASPWPISKLLPHEGKKHNFAIGTLGASLSAFDVIASLAHRHGDFLVDDDSGEIRYHPHPGTDEFKIIMHASHGLLPHLQFDQDKPLREIYRHVGRSALLALVNEQGHLRIDTYFDQVCRPALSEAFQKDSLQDMVTRLADPSFTLLDFVEIMTDKHDYKNAFEGMRHEMKEARESVLHHRPIHWKEVLDDLLYTLNFHAELMPAEDHLTLQSKVMPFVMNVVAAMPLPSGNTILALYDAGKLDMVSGRVTIDDQPAEQGMTTITVDNEGEESKFSYRMFVDCSGQKPLELQDYPFPTLVKTGAARKARAPFEDPTVATSDAVPEEKQKLLIKEDHQTFYPIGGVDIDSAYRLVGSGGNPSTRIYEIAFPHTSGLRPYSYGLQACSDTTAILVAALAEEFHSAPSTNSTPQSISHLYASIDSNKTPA